MAHIFTWEKYTQNDMENTRSPTANQGKENTQNMEKIKNAKLNKGILTFALLNW